MTPTKIYLAARYSRNAEMRGVRDVLVALGFEVTSRWIDQHGGNLLESVVAEKLNANPAGCAHYARIDLEDLEAADMVISFTSADGGGKGGRHIEFGYAIGRGKPVLICGPRENVFHTLAGVQCFPDWPHMLAHLAECPIQVVLGGDPESCAFPRGHAGRHSWAVTADAGVSR